MRELLLFAIPVTFALAGLAARRLRPAAAGRLATRAADVVLVAALAAVALLIAHGPLSARWSPFGPGSAFGLSVRFEVVAAVMTLLVAFLGRIVLGFARSYLAGDPAQARFFSWMCLTLASVLTLILSGNLLLFFLAWIATSLCLHRLLLHYPDRAGAVFSARKKFVVSRLADLCLVAALEFDDLRPVLALLEANDLPPHQLGQIAEGAGVDRHIFGRRPPVDEKQRHR